jgi:hypothetical protein
MVTVGGSEGFWPANNGFCPYVHLGLVWWKCGRRIGVQLHPSESVITRGNKDGSVCKEVVGVTSN